MKSVNPKAPKEFVKTRKWKEWKAGEYVDCTFEGVGNHHDKFGKDIYEFKVIEANFDVEPGSMLYLNCGGNFQNLMGMVSLEDKVRVVYKGMTKITKGKWAGTMTHDIDVQIDDDVTSASNAETSDSLL